MVIRPLSEGILHPIPNTVEDSFIRYLIVVACLQRDAPSTSMGQGRRYAPTLTEQSACTRGLFNLALNRIRSCNSNVRSESLSESHVACIEAITQQVMRQPELAQYCLLVSLTFARVFLTPFDQRESDRVESCTTGLTQIAS